MPPKTRKPELQPFSQRLRDVIVELGVEQKELAAIAEIQAPTVTAYLKAESQPSMLVLSKWAEKYRIDMNWLVLGEGPMFRDEQEQPRNEDAGTKTELGKELADIKAALKSVETSEEEIKQALLDYIGGGRSPLKPATGTDDGSR
ncbi:MAG: helix-turn-helix domain-containing protein [Proteobacteria bacterium]|nr:helix-turn-helix domain-containing protein [Pseudomonadota bacterium]